MAAGGHADLAILPARDIESFVCSPVDRFVARRCFCFWQLGTGVKGVIAWGQPTADDAVEMTRAFEAGAREDERHVSLVDMRALRTIDVSAFEVILRYMTERQEVFARTVIRQALMHGIGAIGAAVAGFYRVVQPTYPVEAFQELDRAIAWLAPADPDAVRGTVLALRAHFVDVSPVLSRLRAAFESHGRRMSLAEAAQALGTSRRALQRELELAGSSFRVEVCRFRLARAEHLLAGTSMPLKSVAAEVEVTPSRLAALFREYHGVSPAAWRARFVRVAADPEASSHPAERDERE